MRAVVLGAGGLAIAAMLVLLFTGWPASEYRHNDFAGFWMGSRFLLDGADPYDAPSWYAAFARIGSHGYGNNPPGIAYGYPLTAAIVFAPFALFPIELAAPLWLVAQATLATAGVVLLARTLFPASLGRDLPVLVALAAASQPALLLAVGGNIGGFQLAIAATSVALLARGRPLAAGAVAGLLVVKPHPLLFAVVLILLGVPRRAAIRALVGGVAVGGAIVLASLVLRPGWLVEFLVPGTAIAGAPVARPTLLGVLKPLGPLAWLVDGVWVVGCLVWVLRRRPDLPTLAAVAIPASLLAAPYLWSYDFLPMVVTVAAILGAVARAEARVRTIVLGLLAVVWILVPWILYVIAHRRGDEALTVVVPLAIIALLAFALRVGRPSAGTPRPDAYGTMPS